MIKKLRYLCTLLLIAVASAAWGQSSESLTWSNLGLANQTSVDGIAYTIGTNFKVTCAKNEASNEPTYYTSGTAVRCYATKSTNNGNTITVATTTDNIYISKVTFNGTHSKKGTTSFIYSGTPTASDATSVTYDVADKVQSATATLCETSGSANGQFYFTSVTVEYVNGSSSDKTPTTTTFGTDAQESYLVYMGETFNAPTATVFANGTELTNAAITYTSTNENVATVNNNGVVSLVAAGTTIIKASYAGDDTYAGSSASYTLNVGNIFANLHALQQGTTTTTAIPMKVTLTDVQVTGVNGKNAYINDGTYGAIIYTEGHGLSEGQMITGTLEASSQLYNGAPEITNFSTTGLTINAGTLTPQEKTISDLSVANEGIYVTIKGLSYDATAATFSDGTSTIAYYDGLKKEIALEDGGNYNVTGVINYRNLLQLYPTAVEKLEAGVETPEFSLDAGSYKGTRTLTLTQPDNLPIYYTIDGTDPTESETAVLYTGAITIEQTTTVKAAAKSGNTWSNVVTHIYTIVPVYADIAALKDAITATSASEAVDMYVTLTNAVVTYINGSNYYIEDGSAGILIYNSSDGVKNFLTKTGLKLNGDMKAAGYIYNGLYQLTKNFDFTGVTAEEGADIPVTEVTIAQLNENLLQYESKRVKVVDATVSSALASRKATIKQNGNSIQIYEKVSGKLAETALATANSVVTVVGYPGINNSTNQLNVWDVADVTEVTPDIPAVFLSFETTSFTVEPKADFTAPSLSITNEAGEAIEGISVTYESSDEDIAIVDENTGEVVIGETEGTVTITATFAGDDTYAAASASYTITVKAATVGEDVVIVEEDKTTFLFNTAGNEWGLPTDYTKEEGSFEANGYTITLAGQTKGYKYEATYKYLILGQNGAYLTLPAFDFKVGKIEIVGREGASNAVKQNIYVGENAVSTETTGATGTNTYVIAADYQAAGNIYSLKVNSAHNTQITQIVVYKATGEEKADPQLRFSAATATATLGSEFAAPTLSYVDGFDGTVVYESSDERVATVDAEGNVILVGAGETTIKATSAETDNYMSGEAFYKLTVKEPAVVGDNKYELVTDATTLNAGDEIVFAYVGTLKISSVDTKVAQAMGTEFGNNSVLLAVDVVDNEDQTISTGDDVMFLTLGGAEDAWTFESNGKYLTSTGKKKNEDGTTPSTNQNTIELTEDGTDTHAQAHIQIAEDGEATVTFNGGNGCNWLQYNVNGGKNQRFSCYSAKMSGLQIYRKVTSTETHSGNVNGDPDGKVDIADVTALVNIIVNNSKPTAEQLAAGDFDNSRTLTVNDVEALVNKILGNQ